MGEMNSERGTTISDITENIECDRSSNNEVIESVSAHGTVTNKCEGSSTGTKEICTYKRRRFKRPCLDIKVQEIDILLDKQKDDINNSCKTVSLPNMNSHDNLLNNASLGDSRKVVLKDKCQSSDVEFNGGLQGCIQDALLSHLKTDDGTEVKECIAVDKERQGEPTKSSLLPDEPHNTIKIATESVSNGHSNGFNHHTITKRCQRALYNVITSENFTALGNLLGENFNGIKDEKLFGLKAINKRMIEGTYEHSPSLFLEDSQQIWSNVELIGTELISLARSLSKMSDNSYKELVIGPLECTLESGNTERGDSDAQRVCSCRRCGGIPHGRDYIICDSCEDMYHVSCLEPPLKEIPSTDWYCTTCTIRGVRTTCTTRVSCTEVIYTSKETPHGVCVVCERLKAMGIRLDGGCCQAIPTNEETLEQVNLSSETMRFCKVCRSEVTENEGSLVCDHPYCPNKYYHSSCIIPEELKVVNGSRWYCSSCLCRACLTDKDDDKIVLCDECDHAYHIYCMRPPHDLIPQGKWFCMECNKGNRSIYGPKAADKKQIRKCTDGTAFKNLGKK